MMTSLPASGPGKTSGGSPSFRQKLERENKHNSRYSPHILLLSPFLTSVHQFMPYPAQFSLALLHTDVNKPTFLSRRLAEKTLYPPSNTYP